MLRAYFPESYGRLSAEFARQFNASRRGMLAVLGASLLSRVQLAYVEKARHGTGDDGIRWDELQRSTLANRVRKRGPGRAIVKQIKALQAELRVLRGAKSTRRRSAPKATTSRTRRTAATKPRAPRRRITRTEAQIGRKLAGKERILQLRYRIQELRAKLESLIDQAVANHEIGVDTGLQRSAAAPGYQDDVWNRVPDDGNGGNEFVVTEGEVTIRYHRSYSEFFDAQRPLMPAEVPANWMAGLEAQAQQMGDVILQRSIDSMGGF